MDDILNDAFENEETLTVTNLDNANQTWEDLVNQVDFVKEKCVFGNDLIDDDSKWNETTITNIKLFFQESASSILVVYKTKNEEISAENINSLDNNGIDCSSKYPLYYFLKPPLKKESKDEDFKQQIIYGSVNLKTTSLLSLQRKLTMCHYQFSQKDTALQTSFNEFETEEEFELLGLLYKSCNLLKKDSILDFPTDNKLSSTAFSSGSRLEVTAYRWLEQLKEMFFCGNVSLDIYQTVPNEMEIYKMKLNKLTTLLKQVESEKMKNFRSLLKQRNANLNAQFDQLHQQMQAKHSETKTIVDIIEKLMEMWLNIQSAVNEEETFACVNEMMQFATEYAKVDILTFHWLIHKIHVAMVEKCVSSISTEKLCQGYILSTVKTINEAVNLASKCQKLVTPLPNDHIGMIKIFIGRCQQLLKLGNFIRLFGSWEDGAKLESSTFNNNCLTQHVLKDSEVIIDELLIELHAVHQTLLDLRSSDWHQTKNMQDKMLYEYRVKEILRAFLNAFKEDFESVKTPDDKLQLLNLLYRFRDTEFSKEINELYQEITGPRSQINPGLMPNFLE